MAQQGKPRGQGQGKGRDKTHTLTNPETGETMDVSQRDWINNKAEYQSQGFQRDDGDEQEEDEEDED
jgi:hypothetical protein